MTSLPWPSLLALLSLAVAPALCSVPAAVRVTFLTDCQMYSDWQSLGMIFSFQMSGQPGKLTRVMCCSDEDRARYNPTLLQFCETHVAPDMSVHPRNKDEYPAYNKPEAVIDYMDHVVPEEEYVLVLDSDMILRRPFLVEEMQPKPGLAVGARYTYMIGVNNELATRHIPEVAPRNDTLAGPLGRRADQVGGFFFMHRDDLKRMSHDWLRYTEDVRFDDQAYRLSGDSYATSPGDKPWISEMYGYAFGAAKAGVWHKWDTHSMIYPAYAPHVMPKLMHYGLRFDISTASGRSFSFDKHHHFAFDVSKCPPWDLGLAMPVAGVFHPPPRPSELAAWDKTNLETLVPYYRDVLSMETLNTLNAAFCDYHLSHCPPSQQLVQVCTEAYERYHEAAAEARMVEALISCSDFDAKCSTWAAGGECTANPPFMQDNCGKACNTCPPPRAADAGIRPPKQAAGEALLAAMAVTVKASGTGHAAVTSAVSGTGRGAGADAGGTGQVLTTGVSGHKRQREGGGPARLGTTRASPLPALPSDSALLVMGALGTAATSTTVDKAGSATQRASARPPTKVLHDVGGLLRAAGTMPGLIVFAVALAVLALVVMAVQRAAGGWRSRRARLGMRDE